MLLPSMTASPIRTVFPLDDACAEAIITPLHEGAMARRLPITLESGPGCRFEHVGQVLAMQLRAVTAGPGAWADLDIAFELPLAGYDTLVATTTLPAGHGAAMYARVDGGAWSAGPIAEAASDGRRMALEGPVTGDRLEGVKLRFTFPEAGDHRFIVSWVALKASDLRQRIERQPWPVDRTWPLQVNAEADWSEPHFRRGLLFDAADLPRLRAKCLRGPWAKLYGHVKARAVEALRREPEDDLGRYQPWSDRRYSRARHASRPFFHESLDLGFAGLIEQDEAMLRHAARYLMCLVHTRQWSCSEESHAVGLTWTQRCFIEEMSTTAAAILLDWLGFALTPAGGQVADQALWDKGLSAIERDVMKFAYLHRNNQGPWFGRARILGALMLEASWPHVEDYADRAMRQVTGDLERYILEDGGTDEGVGYFFMTMHTALAGLMAYVKARGVDARALMPEPFERSERYLKVMAASKPGRVLLAADNSCDRVLGDGLAMLAALYPGQAYGAMLADQLEAEPDTYYRQYMQGGIYSLIFGPEQIPEPRTIVPTFDVLPEAGHATSRRVDEAGRSLRLHVAGCRAAPGHTHFDQGSLVVECDDEPMLIDRGIVRYDDARANLLKASAMHNVLTPVLEGDEHPDQALPRDRAVVPEASGDERRFEAKIDLGVVWPNHAERYERRIVSENLTTWTVQDLGRWTEAMPVAFHLHALSPFEVADDGKSAKLTHAGITLRIEAPWAAEARQSEHLIDFAYRPVYHLVFEGPASETFDLATTLIRMNSKETSS